MIEREVTRTTGNNKVATIMILCVAVLVLASAWVKLERIARDNNNRLREMEMLIHRMDNLIQRNFVLLGEGIRR